MIHKIIIEIEKYATHTSDLSIHYIKHLGSSVCWWRGRTIYLVTEEKDIEESENWKMHWQNTITPSWLWTVQDQMYYVPHGNIRWRVNNIRLCKPKYKITTWVEVLVYGSGDPQCRRHVQLKIFKGFAGNTGFQQLMRPTSILKS